MTQSGMRRKYTVQTGKKQTSRRISSQKQKHQRQKQKSSIIDPVLFINPSKRHYPKSARREEEQTSPIKKSL
jgi:hypothetical protein